MNQTSPVKAIRKYCLNCRLESSNAVKLCAVSECPLWNFRFGKNPFRAKREYTDDERAAMAERLKAARNGREKI